MVIGCDPKENNITGRQWSTFTDRYSQYSVNWWKKSLLSDDMSCDLNNSQWQRAFVRKIYSVFTAVITVCTY